MMKRIIYILLLCVTSMSMLSAQVVEKVYATKAVFFHQKGELDSAKKYIDKAIESSDDVAEDFWYYKGFIYTDLFKKVPLDQYLSNRIGETAAEAFVKHIKISSSPENTVNSKKKLKFIASKYYNAGVKFAGEMKVKEALECLTIFESLFNSSQPGVNLNKYRSDFYMIIATKARNMSDQIFEFDSTYSIANYTEERGVEVKNAEGQFVKYDSTYYNIAVAYFTKILEVDPTRFEAHFGLGSIYYNSVANLHNHMDYDFEIDKLLRITDFMSETCLKALPYMQKAYAYGQKKEDVTYAIANLYHALYDKENEKKYRDEYNELIKSDSSK